MIMEQGDKNYYFPSNQWIHEQIKKNALKSILERRSADMEV